MKNVSENMYPHQKEADTRIYLQAKHAADNGHSRIIIRTVDTDVVVIAIHLFGKLGIEELWIKFGTGKHRWWLFNTCICCESWR